MVPSVSLDDIVAMIGRYEARPRFVAIVLSRPYTSFWDQQVGPHLDYLHLRTGKNLHCFLAGVSMYRGDAPDAQPIAVPFLEMPGGHSNGYFANSRFVEMIESVERAMHHAGVDYRYHGETDVLAVSLKAGPNVALDFTTCVAIDAENFVRVGALPSFVVLVERLLEFHVDQTGTPASFAHRQAATDPVTQLARCVVSFFNLGADAFDRRSEWLRCAVRPAPPRQGRPTLLDRLGFGKRQPS